MSGIHPTLTAALAAEHHRDLVRAAGLSRSVAIATDTADPNRHNSPTHRPTWWARVTARGSPWRTPRSSAGVADDHVHASPKHRRRSGFEPAEYFEDPVDRERGHPPGVGRVGIGEPRISEAQQLVAAHSIGSDREPDALLPHELLD